MNNRQLGNTDVFLSEIGFGCASVWGKKFFPEADAIALFNVAVAQGITFFDTGYSYDDAELRLGNCLRQMSERSRKDVVIASKCGTRISPSGKHYHDWSIDWMKESVDISLKRLHTDYLDMLHLHGPTIGEMTDEVLHFMHDLKKQGTVKAIGVNSFDTDVLTYICENKLFDFVMLDYNIMRQDREKLIEKFYKNEIGVIAGAALAQSLYSNRIFKIRQKKDIWYLLRALKNFRNHMIEGRNYHFLSQVNGCSENQLALRYVLDNPYVTSAVFGTTNYEHLVENIQATNIKMPAEVENAIKKRSNKTTGKLDRK